MRLCAVLYRQHIGWHFKKHWRLQGKRTPIDTGAIKSLKEKGILIYKPEDILGETKIELIEEIPDYLPKPVNFDKTHPNWHGRICYTYKDSNVLLEGLDQAKVITNTVELSNGLPSQLEIKKSSSDLDRKIKRIILNSHILDAQQEKLPKRKDPARPAWNFPRDYGVTDYRVNKIITAKLLQAIELWSDPHIVKQRHIFNDLQFWYPFEKDGDLIQLQLRGDSLVTTLKSLPPVTNESTETCELPNIFPVKYTNTLNRDNIYEIRNIYPIETFIAKRHPHTVFVHYNRTEVQNIFEEEVTEQQFLGRSLMKAFTVASTYARQSFGNDVKILPNPVTVQCVQTDGRLFHFGILQLNSLDCQNSTKNIWYQTPRMALFDTCAYNLGRPTLEGYNNNVIRHLITFYNNV